MILDSRPTVVDVERFDRLSLGEARQSLDLYQRDGSSRSRAYYDGSATDERGLRFLWFSGASACPENRHNTHIFDVTTDSHLLQTVLSSALLFFPTDAICLVEADGKFEIVVDTQLRFSDADEKYQQILRDKNVATNRISLPSRTILSCRYEEFAPISSEAVIGVMSAYSGVVECASHGLSRARYFHEAALRDRHHPVMRGGSQSSPYTVLAAESDSGLYIGVCSITDHDAFTDLFGTQVPATTTFRDMMLCSDRFQEVLAEAGSPQATWYSNLMVGETLHLRSSGYTPAGSRPMTSEIESIVMGELRDQISRVPSSP